MSATKLKEYLAGNNVEYKTIQHSLAYTAQEIAAAAHIPGKQLAKTVMIKINGDVAMAVIPASHRVNFDSLEEYTGAENISLASEEDFRELFPDCEMGAMPPFGNLYGIDVFIDESLTEEMVIAFCAGSHTELIQLTYKDFEKLVNPRVFSFSWKA